MHTPPSPSFSCFVALEGTASVVWFMWLMGPSLRCDCRVSQRTQAALTELRTKHKDLGARAAEHGSDAAEASSLLMDKDVQIQVQQGGGCVARVGVDMRLVLGNEVGTRMSLALGLGWL